MRFRRPCLECGELSLTNRCERHQKIHEQKQRKRLDSLPKKSREQKLLYYDSEFRAKAKHVRETAVACYLCGQRFSQYDRINRDIQADHVYPSLGKNSPILATHGRCNRQKGGKDYTPEDWPSSLPPGR